jgi:hypothetical protein
MNFTELCDEVYVLTNRPDLVAETKSAVRAATLKLHQTDYFYKDLFETGLAFTAAAYIQQLEFRLLVPRWRSLKYLRKTDSAGSDTLGFFDIIVPENVLDNYALNRSNVAYVAGAVLQIRSSTQFQYAILGCYIQPDITEAGYDSWIAIDHPFAIVFEAAATVFKMIGDTEKFAAHSALAQMERQNLVISNIQSTGQ